MPYDSLTGGTMLLGFLGLVLLVACQPAQRQESATIIVTGARVWTGDADNPWAEAIASRGETIVAVGREPDVESLIGDETIVIRNRGGMLVPGFIDAHVHFMTGGLALASVQLRDARTREEFTARIERFAGTIQPGEWIEGGSWDHEKWGGELPRRDWIDPVTPDNPVWITRLDLHMGLANSMALELAGINSATPDVDGGTIVRDPTGNPTGVLKDNAMALMQAAIPPPDDTRLERAVDAATQHVASNGVTTVHDMDGWRSLAACRRARAGGMLRTRIYSVVPLADWSKLSAETAESGRGDDWIRVGGLKGFMDGSLGSHTAAFFEPFTDTPGERGFLINDVDDIKRWVAGADQAGLHVMVHAIGDRAIRSLLDIYSDVARAHEDRDRRFRIEHAQHIHPDDIARFAAQDVIASMQPYHAIDDGRWAERVTGHERSRTTYAFRSLIDGGAHVTFSSDWTVAPADPIEGIYAAVTRRTLDGANPDGWIPEQKITVEEALSAYTREAAYASFEEKIKGTLRPGMLADFVLLDRDLTEVPASDIRNARVLKTIVGGRVVYSACNEDASRRNGS